MSTIFLETIIKAPVERVFDLSRSIDAHIDAAFDTRERAVAGRTSGLIGLGETVTWSAVHFGLRQRLTVKITAMDRPHSFTDTMVSGAFKSMHHRHEFEAMEEGTLMKDYFAFEAPLGLLGRFAERLFLRRYMTHFLVQRNAVLKALAEGDAWAQYLRPDAGTPD